MTDETDRTQPAPDSREENVNPHTGAEVVQPVLAANIAISEAFAEQIGPAGIAAYIDALVSAAARARDGAGDDEVEGVLRERLDSAGIELPEPRYPVIAQELRYAEGQLQVTQGTEVLYGPPDAGPVTHEPDAAGPQDPAAPERPHYT